MSVGRGRGGGGIVVYELRESARGREREFIGWRMKGVYPAV